MTLKFSECFLPGHGALQGEKDREVVTAVNVNKCKEKLDNFRYGGVTNEL